MPSEQSIAKPSPFVAMLAGMSTIGARIREAREAKGWTQAEFARRIKIAGPSLNNLESGESSKPSAETLLRMRDAGINPDYIMRGRGARLLDEIERPLEEITIIFKELSEENRQNLLTIAKTLWRSESANDQSGAQQ